MFVYLYICIFVYWYFCIFVYLYICIYVFVYMYLYIAAVPPNVSIKIAPHCHISHLQPTPSAKSVYNIQYIKLFNWYSCSNYKKSWSTSWFGQTMNKQIYVSCLRTSFIWFFSYRQSHTTTYDTVSDHLESLSTGVPEILTAGRLNGQCSGLYG